MKGKTLRVSELLLCHGIFVHLFPFNVVHFAMIFINVRLHTDTSSSQQDSISLLLYCNMKHIEYAKTYTDAAWSPSLRRANGATEVKIILKTLRS